MGLCLRSEGHKSEHRSKIFKVELLKITESKAKFPPPRGACVCLNVHLGFHSAGQRRAAAVSQCAGPGGPCGRPGQTQDFVRGAPEGGARWRCGRAPDQTVALLPLEEEDMYALCVRTRMHCT